MGEYFFACQRCPGEQLTTLTSALVPQLGLLGSPPDPVGRFPMRGGLSEILRPMCHSVMTHGIWAKDSKFLPMCVGGFLSKQQRAALVDAA